MVEAKRKLAAIMAADVAGYSRLMGDDERATVAALNASREIFRTCVSEHDGRVVDTAGDSVLATFDSVVEAVQCASEVQAALGICNQDLPDDRRMAFRIGVNLGDIIEQADGTIYGDGVNVAARLESLAEPGGICLSGSTYEQVEGKTDYGFEDIGEHDVKNIARPVRAYRILVNGQAGSTEPTKSLSLPDKPSIAVLPFDNLSGDPEQEFFADGLVEDIITTLSKLAGLRVIARNSTFVYKGQAVDVREAARQLDVRYVLEGSVRKSANRVRITAQLIDASSGSHIWAERYDRTIEDIFAVQDEITLVVVTEMQVKLTEGEQARLRYTTTNSIEAWSHWVQGLFKFRQAVAKENMAEALFCWQKALTLDGHSSSLNAMTGYIHCLDARFGWWDDRDVALGKAKTYADRALELDPDNSDANVTASRALLMFGRYEDAAEKIRRAARLAPSSADAAAYACLVLAFAGYPEEAVAHGERSIVLSPNYPGYYLGHLGNAFRLAGRFEEAITAFEAYHARNPGFGLSDLVITYQQIDQVDKAKQVVEQLMSIRRDFTVSAWALTQFRTDTTRLEADIEALRAAGLPQD
jgi:adenylate cyclase